jgi:hypothetical protein
MNHRMTTKGGATLLAVVFVNLVEAPAEAYIDPGTGSYVFQILVATFFGGIYAIKIYWQQVKEYLFGTKKTDRPEENPDKDAPPADKP